MCYGLSTFDLEKIYYFSLKHKGLKQKKAESRQVLLKTRDSKEKL